MKNISKYFIYFIVSFLIISSFSNYFYINILGVGFCFIELAILPIVLVCLRKIRIRTDKIMKILFCAIVLTALAAINLTPKQFPTVIYTIRSFGLFMFAYIIFSEIKEDIWENLFKIFVLAIIGDIIGSLLTISFLISEENETITLINILLAPYVIAYSSVNKKRAIFLLVTILCLISSFLSVTRGNILYVLIAMIITILLKPFKSIINIIVPIIILVFAAYITYYHIENIISEYSPSMHYRLYTKVLEKKSVETGDKIREEHLLYALSHFDEYIIPHGFTTRSTKDVSFKNERLLWSIKDCSLNEFIYTFGIIGYLVPFILLRNIILCYHKRKIPEYKIMVITLSVVLLYLFTGYGLLTFPPTLFTLGCLIGTFRRFHYKISFVSNEKNNIINSNC